MGEVLPSWAFAEMAGEFESPELEYSNSFDSESLSLSIDSQTTDQLSAHFKPLTKFVLKCLSHPSPLPKQQTTLSLPGRMQACVTPQANLQTFSLFKQLALPKSLTQSPMSVARETIKGRSQAPHLSQKAPVRKEMFRPHAKEILRERAREKEKESETKKQTQQESLFEPLRERKWTQPIMASLWHFRDDQEKKDGKRDVLSETDVATKKQTKHHFSVQQSANGCPTLEPPRVGIYALYYILTKLGIVSDATSHWETKQTLEMNDQEIKDLHKMRIEAMHQAMEEEEASQRWGMAAKIFTWMTTFMSIVTGIALMITGVGAVAGALMVAGGLIMATNSILETTGVWNKIAAKLPSNDPEKRRATILWIQVGISVLCMVLAISGGILSGYSAVTTAMSNFNMVFGGVLMIGQGVATAGMGVTLSLHADRVALSREHSKRITELRHRREDLMERSTNGIERMKQLFTDLAKLLDFEAELFRADQSALGR